MPWINRATVERIGQEFKEDVSFSFGEHATSLEVSHLRLKELLKHLRDKERFLHFIDMTCIDFPEDPRRFQGVYILYNPDENERVIVKSWANNGKLPTVSDLWPGAKWAEREAYDMFGVEFVGHENLRRMFMWEGYEHFPLRKDFPHRGST